MDALFKALNNKTRRQILELLQQGEMPAGKIAEHFHMSWPSISHHLDLLKQARLVHASKHGQFVYYTLNPVVLDDLIKWLTSFKSKKRIK